MIPEQFSDDKAVDQIQYVHNELVVTWVVGYFETASRMPGLWFSRILQMRLPWIGACFPSRGDAYATCLGTDLLSTSDSTKPSLVDVR